MSDPSTWAWWRAALAGKEPPIHENVPQWGYYRMGAGGVDNAKWIPVGIYVPNGKKSLIMKYGAATITDMDEIGAKWVYCCQHPISYEHYKEAIDTGKWFDDAPPIGHNMPPLDEDADPFDVIALLLQEEQDKAKQAN